MRLIKNCFRPRSKEGWRRALRGKSVRPAASGAHRDPHGCSSSVAHTDVLTCDVEMRVKKLPQYSRNSIRSKYRLGRVLGKGGFSVVRYAKNKMTGQEFACKIMKLPRRKNERAWEGMSREAMFSEIELASKMNCKNIVSVAEFFITKSKVYIVQDLLQGGIVLDHFLSQEHQRYTEDDARCIFRQVLKGISYLHERNIAHRDLKLQNLMLANKNDLSQIKIIDMGLAKLIRTTTSTNCGSPLFIAPEIFSRTSSGHSLAVDMWSAGVLLFVLLGGYAPFNGARENILFKNIQTCSYDFDKPVWNNVSQSAKDLILQCLLLDPRERLTATQALNHPWIQSQSTGHSSQEFILKTMSKYSFDEARAGQLVG